ncbi:MULTISPECIES: sugar O-acetyltransferase [Ruminococcus]|uniref:sugar O-acetyltransferase n=1 Tax=Ruminococcus TaxID=1263 RepID=UPI00159FC052|nr:MULTISPECIES: sugar O-acetyltransferase [Ruminococcus]
MTYLEMMKQDKPYCCSDFNLPHDEQITAKNLCFEFNNTHADNEEKRKEILSKLFGTFDGNAVINPIFNCDYGFNIHIHGFALINHNCTILDTSPVHIGNGCFIAPGVCISAASHPIIAKQRNNGILISKPIHIGDDVWIGANVTVCGGVTIGKGSVIGAGSVVVKDIPAGVVAVGNPCRVMRKITEADKVVPVELDNNPENA